MCCVLLCSCVMFLAGFVCVWLFPFLLVGLIPRMFLLFPFLAVLILCFFVVSHVGCLCLLRCCPFVCFCLCVFVVCVIVCYVLFFFCGGFVSLFVLCVVCPVLFIVFC